MRKLAQSKDAKFMIGKTSPIHIGDNSAQTTGRNSEQKKWNQTAINQLTSHGTDISGMQDNHTEDHFPPRASSLTGMNVATSRKGLPQVGRIHGI